MVNTDTLTVTISGLNFETGCSASLDSVPLVVSSYTPTTTIEALVPTDIVAGYYDLTVTDLVSRSGTLLNAYTATNPVPLVTGITPAVSVITTTDLVVTISGDNFRDAGAEMRRTDGGQRNHFPGHFFFYDHVAGIQPSHAVGDDVHLFVTGFLQDSFNFLL